MSNDIASIAERARAEIAKLLSAGAAKTNPGIKALRLAAIDDLLRAAPAQLGSLEEVVDRHIYVVGHFERGRMLIAKATFKVTVTPEDAE